jgi:hypothetical protein
MQRRSLRWQRGEAVTFHLNVSREIVQLLLRTQCIEIEERNTGALEAALSSILLEHLLNEERAKWAARALIERRGLDRRSLADALREVAAARGLRVGAEGTADVAQAMVRWIETTAEVSGIRAPTRELRSKVISVLEKYVEVDDFHQSHVSKPDLTNPLVMTPQLYQAIRLLQLSHDELVDQCRQELGLNPLLEQQVEGAAMSEMAPGELSRGVDTTEVSEEGPVVINPDVFIVQKDNGYTVVLNDEMLLQLRIAPAHFNTLRKMSSLPARWRSFLKDKLRAALWFLRTIEERERSIYRVTESIVKFQRDFLANGVGHLKPVLFRQVADDVGLHASTVRRVVTGKYVHTPQGTYPLSYFFKAASAQATGEDLASEAVKTRIREIIDKEDTGNPHSDQRIVELLRAQGIDATRRAVTLYRQLLGVLPPGKRKK